MHYLIAHWPDVLTVLAPFLRPFRLLRVALLVARFWKGMRSTLRQRTFSLMSVTSLIAVTLGATAMFSVERHADGPIKNFADALWWAASTITTVGYGDVYPKTAAGRGVAVFLMLLGISLFGLLTARVAAFFVEDEERIAETPKLDEILARLESIDEQLRELQSRHDKTTQRGAPGRGPPGSTTLGSASRSAHSSMLAPGTGNTLTYMAFSRRVLFQLPRPVKAI